MGVLPAGEQTGRVAGRAGAGEYTQSPGEEIRISPELQEQCFALKAHLYLTFLSLDPFSMQSAEQQKKHQEGQATRLADLELWLNALSAKTGVRLAETLLFY